MRIAQIATLGTPVGEQDAGSVEGLVWLLTRELTRMGHEATVFAAAGSEVCGELVATLPGTYAENGAPGDWQLCEWINICRAVEQSDRFDVLHCHAYMYGLAMEPLSSAPMVHTTHILPSEDEAFLWRSTPGACVTSITRFQWSEFPDLQPAAVIPHGVDVPPFTFRGEPDDYLLYLGRFTPGKGPLQAIEAARAAGMRLLLAGPSNEYFEQAIAPLVDGSSVQYAGYVSGSERDRLLGGARALLYPVASPEPFGLVQIEAMLCGTPVVATSIGAVPEIVDEGVTGYWVASQEDFPRQILRSLELDRRHVRERAVARFSAERMAQDYMQVYEHVVESRDRGRR